MTNSREKENKNIINKYNNISTINNEVNKSFKNKEKRVNDFLENKEIVDLQCLTDICSHSKSDNKSDTQFNPAELDHDPDIQSCGIECEKLKTESTMDTHHEHSMKQFNMNIDRFSTAKMKEIDDAMQMFNFDLMDDGYVCKEVKHA